MKNCKRCKTDKPLGAFNKYKNSSDGLFFYCKQCQSEINKKYTYVKCCICGYKFKIAKIDNIQKEYYCKKCKNIKKCNKCGETKHVSQYYVSKETKDGLFPDCKDCCKTNEPTSSWYRKKRDVKHYNDYWSGRVGLNHKKNNYM